MSTIVSDIQEVPVKIEVRSRKDVFELRVEIQGRSYDLIMVHQYKCDEENSLMNNGIFVQDTENDDFWHFPLGMNQEEIMEKISLSIQKES